MVTTVRGAGGSQVVGRPERSCLLWRQRFIARQAPDWARPGEMLQFYKGLRDHARAWQARRAKTTIFTRRRKGDDHGDRLSKLTRTFLAI
jgi:hypothetical protein